MYSVYVYIYIYIYSSIFKTAKVPQLMFYDFLKFATATTVS